MFSSRYLLENKTFRTKWFLTKKQKKTIPFLPTHVGDNWWWNRVQFHEGTRKQAGGSRLYTTAGSLHLTIASWKQHRWREGGPIFLGIQFFVCCFASILYSSTMFCNTWNPTRKYEGGGRRSSYSGFWDCLCWVASPGKNLAKPRLNFVNEIRNFTTKAPYFTPLSEAFRRFPVC